MARIYTITQSVQTGSGSVGGAITNSGDGAIEFDFTIAPAAANQANFINIIQSDIKTCLLVFNATGSTGGSIGGHLTLKTNSSGSPQDTITLVDGVPIIYNSAPAFRGCSILRQRHRVLFHGRQHRLGWWSPFGALLTTAIKIVRFSC